MKVNKAFAKVFNKYTNFTNVFLSKLATKLSRHTRINNYTIKLVDNKQSLYSSIYNLGLIELKTLKIYIKNNLVNGFIRLFKFFTKTLIFFNKKLDKNLKLYINY